MCLIISLDYGRIYLFHFENKNIISNDQEQLLVDGCYCEDPH
jgi:hypothetical protein